MTTNKKTANHVTARPFVQETSFKKDDYWGEVWDRTKNFGANERVASTTGKYCAKPFTWFEIQIDGRVFMCCPTWLPYPVGNVFENTISEIWNSERVIKIRESIYDGSFKYCNKPLCPDIQAGYLKDLNEIPAADRWIVDQTGFPKNINFSTDESCNLSCPSCRTSKILHSSGPDYDHRQLLDDKIWSEIMARPKDIDINIHITGSGDPFGSKIFRERLLSLDATERPNMRFHFKTNGVMLTPKIWEQLHRIHRNIKNIHISFDAGTEQTYNITRRGGDWNTLIENMRALDPIARDNGIQLFYDYVVQAANATEMLDFCKLINEISPNYYLLHFTRISDWGTWPTQEFERQAVWMESHPDHQAWLQHIANPEFDKYRINWANNAQFRKIAIEKFRG